MKNILKIELTLIQKGFLWLITFASLIVKILLDSFFLLVEKYDTPFPLTLRFIFSFIVFLSLLVLFFSNFENKFTHEKTSFSQYLIELIRIVIFYFVLLIFSMLLPSSIIGGGAPRSFIEIIYINAYSLAALILSLMILQFFFKWIWHRRFKWTKKHLKIIIVLVAAQIIILDIPNYFTHLAPEEIKENSFLFVLSLLLNISLIIVTFWAAKKKEWIATLSLADKWKVFGLSFALILLTVATLNIDSAFEGDGKLSNAVNSLFPTNSLLGISTIIILIYSIRIALSAILSMPTSSIIQKKYSEFHSLTYLNRVIAQSIDFDNLIETVSKLSLSSGSGNVVWTDFINSEDELSIHSLYTAEKSTKPSYMLIKQLETEFYTDKSLNVFKNLSSPYYVESIKNFENNALRKLFKILNVQSVIIVPLLSASKRIGTLYLAHSSEYGFDSDFLTLLSAFSDNLNIAIDNISLLEASIEKEKYKKELIIARDIAGKLIPETMPNLQDYSLSGYTIPAEEVGGDYYDVITLKDGKHCILIGDVSGKGMSAAFYMVLLKGVVLSVQNQVETPAELLKKINSVLFQEMEKQMFVTLAAVKIEDNKGNLTLVRAGHLPFILKNENQTIDIKPKGIGVGLAPSDLFDNTIEEHKMKLSKKESLIMYSDGLVEIFKDNKEIKQDFLKQIVNKSVYFNSSELLNDITKEIEELKKEYNFIDDMTLLCLTYNNNIPEIENA